MAALLVYGRSQPIWGIGRHISDLPSLHWIVWWTWKICCLHSGQKTCNQRLGFYFKAISKPQPSMLATLCHVQLFPSAFTFSQLASKLLSPAFFPIHHLLIALDYCSPIFLVFLTLTPAALPSQDSSYLIPSSLNLYLAFPVPFAWPLFSGSEQLGQSHL